MSKTELYFDGKPPEVGGVYQVQSFVTANGAANSRDWAGGLTTDVPKGPVWVEVQAQGNHAVIRFSSTTSTGTTLTNGIKILVGSPPQKFFVDPVKHRYIDTISETGAGTIQVHVCSNIHQRNTQ